MTVSSTYTIQFRLAIWTKDHGEEETNSMALPLIIYFTPFRGKSSNRNKNSTCVEQLLYVNGSSCQGYSSEQVWCCLWTCGAYGLWMLHSKELWRTLKQWYPISGSFQQRLWNIYPFVNIYSGKHWRESPGQPDLCWEVANWSGRCMLTGSRLVSPTSFTPMHMCT